MARKRSRSKYPERCGVGAVTQEKPRQLGRGLFPLDWKLLRQKAAGWTRPPVQDQRTSKLCSLTGNCVIPTQILLPVESEPAVRSPGGMTVTLSVY